MNADYDDSSTVHIRIRKVSTDGTISTFAGAGSDTSLIDGNLAIDADLGWVTGIEADPAGNLYLAMPYSPRVLQIDWKGVVRTVAGTGLYVYPVLGADGYAFDHGDGGFARSAQVLPLDVALDSTGRFLYIAEPLLVRRVSFGVAPPSDTPSFRLFEFNNRGGISMTTDGGSEQVSVGYGRVRGEGAAGAPSGVAIFGFRQNGVLIGEAGVPATPPVQSGRIDAEVQGAVNTGIAMANPSSTSALIEFYFTDSSGMDFGHGSLSLGPSEQVAKFLNQVPFNAGTITEGTFTFSSSVPIVAVALRGYTNERSEFLTTTLPMIVPGTGSSSTATLPHFADGGGWTTRVSLVNPTDEAIAGTMEFRDAGGESSAAQPMMVQVDGMDLASGYPYSIPPRSVEVFRTTGVGAGTASGTVRVLPDTDAIAPVALGIFSYHPAGIVVTEAGVSSVPAATAFRMYVESSGEPGVTGSISSGLAIANSTANTGTVVFSLTDMNGTVIGPAVARTLPASGQIVTFVDQLFGSLDPEFAGVLRISSPGEPIVVTGLRSRVNERSDFLITTTPPVSETSPAATGDLYFPHIADSGGWSTQFVLFSGTPGSSSGNLQFYDQSGNALGLIGQ